MLVFSFTGKVWLNCFNWHHFAKSVWKVYQCCASKWRCFDRLLCHGFAVCVPVTTGCIAVDCKATSLWMFLDLFLVCFLFVFYHNHVCNLSMYLILNHILLQTLCCHYHSLPILFLHCNFALHSFRIGKWMNLTIQIDTRAKSYIYIYIHILFFESFTAQTNL